MLSATLDRKIGRNPVYREFRLRPLLGLSQLTLPVVVVGAERTPPKNVLALGRGGASSVLVKTSCFQKDYCHNLFIGTLSYGVITPRGDSRVPHGEETNNDDQEAQIRPASLKLYQLPVSSCRI